MRNARSPHEPLGCLAPSGGYTEYRDVTGNVTSLNGVAAVQIGAQPIPLETAPLP